MNGQDWVSGCIWGDNSAHHTIRSQRNAQLAPDAPYNRAHQLPHHLPTCRKKDVFPKKEHCSTLPCKCRTTSASS